jgi:dipeptidase E
LQFLEENDTPVAGLREGAMIRIERGSMILKGSTGARIFRKNGQPIEVKPGSSLDELLAPRG